MKDVKLNNKLRIGWLDSVSQPSRIHLTTDNGKSTICGYNLNTNNWEININVPRSIKGESRYCRVCFKDGGKSLPWIKTN